MSLDATKFVEYLEQRVDPELVTWIKGRLASPVHDAPDVAYRVMSNALSIMEHEDAEAKRMLTMRSLDYGATLSPEQEEDLLRRMFL